tara:strand:- start:1110 stop:2375 length:1266 start_codon:yes stop_codon:yes gene_type:complete
MSTIAINPLIVQVKQNDLEIIPPINPTMHKGGIGKLVGVVAAVAVPFAAPAIASSIAASGVLGASITAAMTTTAGGIISSAIAGAALGGITAAVTGQSISRGALIGGLGGGIGGYTQGVSAGTGAGAGLQPTLDMSATPTLQTTASPEAIAGLAQRGGTATSLTGGFGQGGVPTSATSFADNIISAAQDTGSKVLDKLTDKGAIANLTLQAAGSLIGEAMVPEGTLAQLSPEEQSLLEERKEELQALKLRDLERYNQAIELSKAYMVQAGQIDPTYFANQEMAKSKIGSARTINKIKEQAALDNMSFSEADARRLSLDSNKLAQSKFDEGYMTGLDTKTKLVGASQDAMPTASQTVNYSAGLKDLQDVYAGQRAAADTERENIQMMFAGLNTKEGNTPEEAARKAKFYDDYMTNLTNIGTT